MSIEHRANTDDVKSGDGSREGSREGSPEHQQVQQEIFGRFVLLEQLDAQGAETQRAVDLDRELQPVVTLRRLPRWGMFPKREREAFDAASKIRAKSHGELLVPHVDTGVIEGVPYWASQYVPGISLDLVIERAIDRGALSKGFALTTAYCAIACLLDLVADRFDRGPNILVAPLIHPRRFIVSWSGRPFFLGTSYEQSHADDEERRFTPPNESKRAHAGADAFSLAGIIYEMCTGLPFDEAAVQSLAVAGSAPTVSGLGTATEGPLGSVPAELRRVLGAAVRLEHNGVRELMHVVEPLMKAAGGGHFSEVAQELTSLCGDVQQAEGAQLERDSALARRLRKRISRIKSTEAATMRLRVRPASQEGEALLDDEAPKGDVPGDMLLVAGGRYLFGTFGSAVVPPTYVDVAPFLIDKFPVTNADFFKYVQAARVDLPASWAGRFPDEIATHPITGITPEEADAYAKWAGKRLLSEIEWELAARGFDGRMWPWGHAFDRDCLGPTWTKPWNARKLEPVGAHAPHGDSPFGVSDIGQAWEWTSTVPKEGGRIVRGGPWRNRMEPPQISNRSREEFACPDVMFRCARSIDIPRIGLAKPPPPAPVRAPQLDEDTRDDIE